MAGRRIRLSSSAGFFPGGGWDARNEFRARRDRIEFWADDPDTGRMGKVADLPEPFSWRACATYMASDDFMHHIPAEAMSEACMEGESSWRADVLLLCWCRWEDDTVSYGQDLLTLSDEYLQILADDYGSLVDSDRKSSLFLQRYERLLALLEEAETSASLSELVSTFKIPAMPGFFEALLKSMKRQVQRRDALLSIWGTHILGCVKGVTDGWPRPRSVGDGRAFSSREDRLRSYVRAHLVQHGGLPHGRHEVPELGSVEFPDAHE